MRADDVARAVEVIDETLAGFVVLRIAHGGDDRVHMAIGDFGLRALSRAVRALEGDDAAHLLGVANRLNMSATRQPWHIISIGAKQQSSLHYTYIMHEIS